mmetsp:Transcript_115817/g.181006  ORF Transcript_115817/g.181006 Transcript_115817/m.181006 type:complete len:170 (-) Transcript_115817:97-606(-)
MYTASRLVGSEVEHGKWQDDHSQQEVSTDESQGAPSEDGTCSFDEYQDLPVKSTFIHFARPGMMRRCSSSPALLGACPFQLKPTPAQLESHNRGDCRPCAYFAAKTDGCRWGAECEFCHLCPSTEIKKRKKEKAKALKEEWWLRRGGHVRRSPKNYYYEASRRHRSTYD